MASPQAMFCFGLLSLLLFAYFWIDDIVQVIRFRRKVRQMEREYRLARGK